MALTRRSFLHGTACCAASAALTGCMTTNVATGRQSFTGVYSIEDDIQIGREEHPKMVEAFGGLYQDRKLAAYVDSIGLRLAEHAEYQQFTYQFTLLNSPIVNAFAIPGGYVYVTRGLLALASNEAELAGVIAHELGHVNARHGAERRSAQQLAGLGVLAGAIGAAALGLPSGVADLGQTIAALAIQGYSRSQELESDTLGVRYMSRAGYDPEAMVTFLASLREHSSVEAASIGLPPGTVDEYNIMATHPRTVERVQTAQAAAQVQRPTNPVVRRQAYLQSIDGMLFGDDPAQGITIGRRFVHPGLRFEFTVPEGFRVSNDTERVVAQHPRGAAVVFDIAATRKGTSMPAYVRQEWAPQAPLRGLEAITVNGTPAGTAQVSTNGRRGPEDFRLVAIRRDDASAYRLLFITPQKLTGAFSEPFRRTTYSFRTLTPAEAAAVRPLRLAIVPAGDADTVEALARALPYGDLNGAWFRVLNDLEPGAEPKPGDLLKTIVS